MGEGDRLLAGIGDNEFVEERAVECRTISGQLAGSGHSATDGRPQCRDLGAERRPGLARQAAGDAVPSARRGRRSRRSRHSRRACSRGSMTPVRCSLALSVLTSLGCQAGGVGIGLWSTTLLVRLLRIKPAEASYLIIYAGFVALGGRFAICYLSDAIGRRPSGVLLSFGAALSLALAGYYHDVFIGCISIFYLMLSVSAFWRWRIRRCRPLFGGNLAVKTSRERHGVLSPPDARLHATPLKEEAGAGFKQSTRLWWCG